MCYEQLVKSQEPASRHTNQIPLFAVFALPHEPHVHQAILILSNSNIQHEFATILALETSCANLLPSMLPAAALQHSSNQVI
jgi:hypothetical protein